MFMVVFFFVLSCLLNLYVWQEFNCFAGLCHCTKELHLIFFFLFSCIFVFYYKYIVALFNFTWVSLSLSLINIIEIACNVVASIKIIIVHCLYIFFNKSRWNIILTKSDSPHTRCAESESLNKLQCQRLHLAKMHMRTISINNYIETPIQRSG